MATPFQKFASLPGAERFLKPDVTLESLNETSMAVTDLAAAKAVQDARATLYRTIAQAIKATA